MRPRRAASVARLAAAAGLAALAALPLGAQGHPEAARIVSVGGSITEVVYALGEENRLIARDTTSSFPPEAQELPDVGYMRALSPEGLLAVGPDLILAEEGSGPAETIEQMRAAAVPFVQIPDQWDGEGVVAKIRAVAEALGVPEKGEALAARVGGEIAEARAFAAAQPGRPRVLFILSTQGGRILASGAGTQAAGMIALAGAQNAVTEYEGYKPLTDEAVIAAAPDIILMMERGGDHGSTADALFALPAMALTPAAKERRLVQRDGLYMIGFGPRTGIAVRDLAEALHAPAGATGQ